MDSIDVTEPKVRGNRSKRVISKYKVPTRVMKKVAEDIVFGKKTKVEAAKELGVDRMTVFKALSRPQIKEHLLRIANYNAENIVPMAMDNVGKYVEKLNTGKDLSDKEMDLGYKATQDSLKMRGLLNTGGDSYHLTQIYHDQKVLISPAIQSLLDEHSKKFNFSEDEVKLIEDATGTYSQGTEGRKK